MRKPNLHKRMYAVSMDDLGIVAGTMAYSRKHAITLFLGDHPNIDLSEWENFKRSGYRTVMARIQIIRRP